MALPKLIDEVIIKKWHPEMKRKSKCFLYDFDNMGITMDQFAEIIIGQKALVFEKPFSSWLRITKCPWCEFKEKKSNGAGLVQEMQDHVFTHPGKTIISPQILKFQMELYTIRLQLVRKGYHECIAMLVEHECQVCAEERIEGRELMCSIPTSTRNRMRCLKTLGYPIKHITKNKNRMHEWSALGVIILLKSGL